MIYKLYLIHENGVFSPCQGLAELSGLPGCRVPSFRDPIVLLLDNIINFK